MPSNGPAVSARERAQHQPDTTQVLVGRDLHNPLAPVSDAREARLYRLAEAYLKGVSQADMAANESITTSAVADDLALLRERWRAAAALLIEERVAVELARIDALEREYWAAWSRSQREGIETEQVSETHDGRTTARKYAKADEDPYVTLPPSMTKRVRALKTTRDGTAIWLEGVRWCIETRLKVMGLLKGAAQPGPIPGQGGGVVGSMDSVPSEERADRLRALVDGIVARASTGGELAP